MAFGPSKHECMECGWEKSWSGNVLGEGSGGRAEILWAEVYRCRCDVRKWNGVAAYWGVRGVSGGEEGGDMEDVEGSRITASRGMAMVMRGGF